jgi:hypothetical protein
MKLVEQGCEAGKHDWNVCGRSIVFEGATWRTLLGERIAKLETPCQSSCYPFSPAILILIFLSILPTDTVKTSFASLSDTVMVVKIFRSCRRDVHPIDDSRGHALPFRILLGTDCRVYSEGINVPTYTVCRELSPCHLLQYRRWAQCKSRIAS